jgi:hypothetical protein
MRKYEPLRRYLRRQRDGDCDLTFGEIERLIGALLPNRAAHSSWWTGASGLHSQAWTSVGFEAVPSPRQDRVFFRRISV